jgi:hypothetical protein
MLFEINISRNVYSNGVKKRERDKNSIFVSVNTIQLNCCVHGYKYTVLNDTQHDAKHKERDIVAPVLHTMKTWESGGIAPPSLTSGIDCIGWVGPRADLKTGEYRNLLPMVGTEPWPSSPYPFATPTELSQF